MLVSSDAISSFDCHLCKPFGPVLRRHAPTTTISRSSSLFNFKILYQFVKYFWVMLVYICKLDIYGKGKYLSKKYLSKVFSICFPNLK